MPPHDLTRFSVVSLISYLPWQDLMCSCSQSGACASCPSLTVSKHPCGSDTCQCVLSDPTRHTSWKQFTVGKCDAMVRQDLALYESGFSHDPNARTCHTHASLHVCACPFAVSMWPMVCVSVPGEQSAKTLCHLQPGRESGSPHRSTHGWAPRANTFPTHPVACRHVHMPVLRSE